MSGPEMKKAPRPGGAIENRNSVHLEDEGNTMSNIVPPVCPPVEFDTRLPVAARFVGDINVDVQHEDWIGENLVRVETPTSVLHLSTHEARDLAEALQTIALFIDEEIAR